MPMMPIPHDVLEAAMTRIRGGEMFETVRASLHLSADRLRHQLKQAYPDFEAHMRRHKQHRKVSAAPARDRTPQAKPTRPLVTWKLTRPATNTFVEADQAEHVRHMLTARPVRGIAQFSAQELAALQRKVETWITGGVGTSISC